MSKELLFIPSSNVDFGYALKSCAKTCSAYWRCGRQSIQFRLLRVHHVRKNVRPTLACYNFDSRESSLIIFGKNVTKKVSSQMVLYFPISSSYCIYTTLRNRKPGNCVCSLICCMLLPDFSRSLFDFFVILVDSQRIGLLLCSFLNLVVIGG